MIYIYICSFSQLYNFNYHLFVNFLNLQAEGKRMEMELYGYKKTASDFEIKHNIPSSVSLW